MMIEDKINAAIGNKKINCLIAVTTSKESRLVEKPALDNNLPEKYPYKNK